MRLAAEQPFLLEQLNYTSNRRKVLEHHDSDLLQRDVRRVVDCLQHHTLIDGNVDSRCVQARLRKPPVRFDGGFEGVEDDVLESCLGHCAVKVLDISIIHEWELST